MKKSDRDVEMIFTYRLPHGAEYGLSTGEKGCYCTREFFEFDNMEEIENLMLGLADMLNKLRLKTNGRILR